ncbi:hypothetical protein M9458_052628 [Cirrhinus mrigala]|uniref:Uncharacterized protein n=1 Tax=Cirrhinus mrigala TaxID=683832 RepID=A0ABD0MQ38_CIRMR
MAENVVTRKKEKSKQAAALDQDGDSGSDGLDTERIIHSITVNITAAVEDKFNKFAETLDAIASKVHDNSVRLGELETRDTEDKVSSMDSKLVSYAKKVEELKKKLDNLENRSRRDNIIVTNLPEGMEGQQPVKFFESWLPRFLEQECHDGQVNIDAAYRLGSKEAFTLQQQQTRAVIIKLHSFRDKVRVLSAAKAKKQLLSEGRRVSIQQDLSQMVRQKRHGLNHICSALLQRGTKFNMLFPNTFRVYFGNGTMTFSSPQQAQDYLNSISNE